MGEEGGEDTGPVVRPSSYWARERVGRGEAFKMD